MTRPPESVTAKDIHGHSYGVPLDRLRWRPSAYVIVIQDGAVPAVPDRHNRYDLPGGGIEFGEMPEAAVVREAFEETGLHITAPQLGQVASSFFKMPDAPDDFIQSLMLYYRAQVASGELSTAGHDSFERSHLKLAEWLPLDRLDTIQLTSSIDWRRFIPES